MTHYSLSNTELKAIRQIMKGIAKLEGTDLRLKGNVEIVDTAAGAVVALIDVDDCIPLLEVHGIDETVTDPATPQ